MTNLAITDNLNSCKNNYYYALTSESVPNSPPNILPSHTGIADSGTTDFYFAPDAPITNYNPQAPTVGVRVANGWPERSVASATLASVPSLPQASMTGHVMPAFPQVTVYHPDGHTLLSGWRDETGPCLWHFPLTTEAAQLSWECRHFRCRPQLVLKTCLRVFPTQRPDTADVLATSCDVGFFFSVSYVVLIPNCLHVVVVTTTTYHTHLV